MSEIVDYAFPTMMAERCLKDLHDAFLKQDIDLAQVKAVECVRWVAEIQVALREHKNAKAKG